MIVRRLRSIRLQLDAEQGEVEAAQRRDPAGGRVDGLRGHACAPSVCVGPLGSSLGSPGEAEERVLEAAGGDLEVAGVGLGEQVARDRVGVLGVHVDRRRRGRSTLVDAAERGERVGVGVRQGGPDGAAGGQRLDLGAGAVGDDPAVADQDDPVGVLVGLLEVVRREEHRAALLRRRARIADQKERRPSTSMPVVGSSSSSSAGSDSSAIAKRSRCCSPPEHLPTLRSAIAGRCRRVARTSSTGLVSAKRLAVYCDGLADGEVLEQAAGLHHRRDEAAGDGLAGLDAEHLDRARGGLRQAEDHVDGRGLAGAVGAEEGHDLAGLELEVDAADGVHVTEVLGHPGQAYGVHRRAPRVARGGRGRGVGLCHGLSLSHPRLDDPAQSSRTCS